MFACLHQPGGCDYTIGCGNLLIGLTSENVEDAKKELKTIIEERYADDYRRLPNVTLIQGTSIELCFTRKKKKTLQDAEDEKGRLTYEKLKQKFEKDK